MPTRTVAAPVGSAAVASARSLAWPGSPQRLSHPLVPPAGSARRHETLGGSGLHQAADELADALHPRSPPKRGGGEKAGQDRPRSGLSIALAEGLLRQALSSPSCIRYSSWPALPSHFSPTPRHDPSPAAPARNLRPPRPSLPERCATGPDRPSSRMSLLRSGQHAAAATFSAPGHAGPCTPAGTAETRPALCRPPTASARSGAPWPAALGMSLAASRTQADLRRRRASSQVGRKRNGCCRASKAVKRTSAFRPVSTQSGPPINGGFAPNSDITPG